MADLLLREIRNVKASEAEEAYAAQNLLKEIDIARQKQRELRLRHDILQARSGPTTNPIHNERMHEMKRSIDDLKGQIAAQEADHEAIKAESEELAKEVRKRRAELENAEYKELDEASKLSAKCEDLRSSINGSKKKSDALNAQEAKVCSAIDLLKTRRDLALQDLNSKREANRCAALKLRDLNAEEEESYRCYWDVAPFQSGQFDQDVLLDLRTEVQQAEASLENIEGQLGLQQSELASEMCEAGKHISEAEGAVAELSNQVAKAEEAAAATLAVAAQRVTNHQSFRKSLSDTAGSSLTESQAGEGQNDSELLLDSKWASATEGRQSHSPVKSDKPDKKALAQQRVRSSVDCKSDKPSVRTEPDQAVQQDPAPAKTTGHSDISGQTCPADLNDPALASMRMKHNNLQRSVAKLRAEIAEAVWEIDGLRKEYHVIDHLHTPSPPEPPKAGYHEFDSAVVHSKMQSCKRMLNILRDSHSNVDDLESKWGSLERQVWHEQRLRDRYEKQHEALEQQQKILRAHRQDLERRQHEQQLQQQLLMQLQEKEEQRKEQEEREQQQAVAGVARPFFQDSSWSGKARWMDTQSTESASLNLPVLSNAEGRIGLGKISPRTIKLDSSLLVRPCDELLPGQEAPDKHMIHVPLSVNNPICAVSEIPATAAATGSKALANLGTYASSFARRMAPGRTEQVSRDQPIVQEKAPELRIDRRTDHKPSVLKVGKHSPRSVAIRRLSQSQRQIAVSYPPVDDSLEPHRPPVVLCQGYCEVEPVVAVDSEFGWCSQQLAESNLALETGSVSSMDELNFDLASPGSDHATFDSFAL